MNKRQMIDDTLLLHSGSNWNRTILKSLGIQIQSVETLKDLWGIDESESFSCIEVYEILDLNLSNVSLCEQVMDNNTLSYITYDVVKNLYNVVYHYPGQESCVDDLGKSLLGLIGISRIRNITVSGPTQLSMFVAGSKISANPDICVEKRNTKIILVVQEDKSMIESSASSPEAQLVAEMLAAYNRNRNTETVDNQNMIGIILLGSQSTFYSMQLTEDILDSIQRGVKSDKIIAVLKKYSISNNNPRYMVDDPKNIKKVLSCYESLKKLLSTL
jgi:hypothetical protein